LPETLYRLGTVQSGTSGNEVEVEPIATNEFIYINKSKLTKPTATYPVYIREGEEITIHPSTISSDVVCSFVKKPKEVNWTYEEVNGVALYNASAEDHQDFELHASEETNIVNKVLLYAGLTIKQPDIVQVADGKETKKITQEKS